MQRRKVSGVRQFFMQLRDITMSGYDVWGGEDAGEEVKEFGCIALW